MFRGVRYIEFKWIKELRFRFKWFRVKGFEFRVCRLRFKV
jgi:hypothetical protein